VNTPELCGAKAPSSALAALPRKAVIDEVIWNLRRENPQQFRSADRRKFHAFHATS
jgi:hypothetical protein